MIFYADWGLLSNRGNKMMNDEKGQTAPFCKWHEKESKGLILEPN
jgi:hypothetical protein